MGKIRTVEISGDTYPISFGMAALSEFLDSAGLGLSELENLQSKLTLSNTIQLVHIGLVHGGRKASQPYKGAFLDTCDLLDQDDEALAKVLDMFADSLPQAEKKKQAPAKKKRPSRSHSTH